MTINTRLELDCTSDDCEPGDQDHLGTWIKIKDENFNRTFT